MCMERESDENEEREGVGNWERQTKGERDDGLIKEKN